MAADKATQRAEISGSRVDLQTAMEGYSHLASSEHLPDEKAPAVIGVFHRARALFAAHGSNHRVGSLLDDGTSYGDWTDGGLPVSPDGPAPWPPQYLRGTWG